MEKITFKDLKLKESILKAIDDLGYTDPSQIQAEAIPLAIEGYDIIGQAQTGTGKTAAFGCSIINNIVKGNYISSIILTPTRELAIQIYEELKKLSKYEKLNVVAIYGGDSIQRQIREIKAGADIIVGTPGRVLDLINRKVLPLSKVQCFVLDEADEMLNMGFIDDIESVIKELPDNKQTLLFSATMPKQIQKLAENYMKDDYKIVNIKKVSLTVSKIKQNYFEVKQSNKFEALCRVLDYDTPNSAIIFCKTKKGVDELVENLQAKNYLVEGMHGDMSQLHRMRTLKRFKEGSLSFLVATDVAARGIDVEGITHVINYDLTQDVESYVHRIGRTGRANKEGTAYSFITPKENQMLKQIRNVTKGKIEKLPVPTVKDILSSKFKSKIKDIENTLNENNYADYLITASDLCDHYDPINIISALMKMQFDKEMSFKYTKNEIEVPTNNYNRDNDDSTVRLFFSIGKRDNLTPKTLVKYITEKANINSKKINKIDILDSFSFVSVNKEISNLVLDKCSGHKINKRKVNVEVANKKKK
ncbi:MAG: DEAD/DEAH box helicase [Clostridiales bacterium]|nr:DEAD/DEAH box helicase [Clostridiales bacterium]